MDYLGFILAAYLVTALVLLGLIVWVVADGRIQSRMIDDLERSRAGRGDGQQS